MIVIDIAQDYTKTPGGRFINEGKFSGEDFREKILRPKFEQAKLEKTSLLIKLDGGYGYATSFLEEAFGGLARVTKDKDILNIKFESLEEPSLIPKIKGYMEAAL